MAGTSTSKGKRKALPSSSLQNTRVSSSNVNAESDGESDSEASSSSSSSSDSASDSDEDITTEYLDSLLDKARKNIANAMNSNSTASTSAQHGEEDVIRLGDGDLGQPQLPPLDSGLLPDSYITFGATRRDPPARVRDLEAEKIEASSSALKSLPAPPIRPPSPSSKLTKKQQKAMRTQTAGKDWFDLPAPRESELPRLYREVEALRLRNQLDPKRFYKKDEGEGKGIKGLPKYLAMGKIVETSSPFKETSGDNLGRGQKKRTLVDELVDDAEAKRYAKKKFGELQVTRGAKGRGTLQAKKDKRKPKW